MLYFVQHILLLFLKLFPVLLELYLQLLPKFVEKNFRKHYLQ